MLVYQRVSHVFPLFLLLFSLYPVQFPSHFSDRPKCEHTDIPIYSSPFSNTHLQLGAVSLKGGFCIIIQLCLFHDQSLVRLVVNQLS